MKLRTALISTEGNPVASEYFAVLAAADMTPDLIFAVGRSHKSDRKFIRKRTAGRWQPDPIPPQQPVEYFEERSDPTLIQRLNKSQTDIAIQGGLGIIGKELLAAPRLGFVNVHPGRLPQYRGRSCPEWAVYNGEDVYATAHFIDEGIDTGPVILQERYEIQDDWDYFDFRANLYTHCARVLVKALLLIAERLEKGADQIAVPQDLRAGKFWDHIPPEALQDVIARFDRLPRTAR